jgi:two-component system OmpR family sensor kinase
MTLPGRSRLPPAGLRWRLALAVAVVTVACTGIAFAVVYGRTGPELRSQVDQGLRDDAQELSGTLLGARAHTPAQLAALAQQYVGRQPFHIGSTLLFVQVRGYPTITNRPELFQQSHSPDTGETAAEQERENQLAARLLGAHEGISTVTVADIGQLRLLRTTLRAHGQAPAVLGAGEPLTSVAEAKRGVARAFVLAGLLALAGALLAAFAIGTRLSRPLRRMAAVAARVDAGDLHPRMHDPGGLGDEIEVLAESFNHMLDRLRDAFAGQRAFIADASHELRTPLTVIRGQIEVLAAEEDPSGQEVRRVERLVTAEINRMSRLVDDLLLLAKSEQNEFLHVKDIDVQHFVEELWDGISLLSERDFELGHVPAGRLLADPDRLAQALRNLIGNAIDHTAPGEGLVRLRVLAIGGGELSFLVEDDGPGIPEDQREAIFRRFHRTDAARTRIAGGTGLGLAIVRAIAEAHGGSVLARTSPEGGASMQLTLPGFSASRRSRGPVATHADALRG